MYVSEAMITACEDMQRNASEMESQIKDMMEMEARNHGMELDKRKSARDLWNEMNAHMSAEMPAGEGQMQDTMPSEYEPASEMEEAEAPAPVMEEAPASDPMEHTHDDGMTHSHEGGDMPHTHDEETKE